MGNYITAQETVQIGEIGDGVVNVVYIQWSGGGCDYEFYAAREEGDEIAIYKSSMGYGNPTSALIDGYMYQLTGNMPDDDDADAYDVSRVEVWS